MMDLPSRYKNEVLGKKKHFILDLKKVKYLNLV